MIVPFDEEMRKALGDIVRERDQLRAALRELVEALPRCVIAKSPLGSGICGHPATWIDDDEDPLCAMHKSPESRPVPWAQELRSALALLEAKAGGR
jgi:hypothetical protein